MEGRAAGGTLQACARGSMEVWRYGVLEARCRCADVEYRGIEARCRRADTRAWMYGDLEVWRRVADVEKWRYRGMDRWR